MVQPNASRPKRVFTSLRAFRWIWKPSVFLFITIVPRKELRLGYKKEGINALEGGYVSLFRGRCYRRVLVAVWVRENESYRKDGIVTCVKAWVSTSTRRRKSDRRLGYEVLIWTDQIWQEYRVWNSRMHVLDRWNFLVATRSITPTFQLVSLFRAKRHFSPRLVAHFPRKARVGFDIAWAFPQGRHQDHHRVSGLTTLMRDQT